MSRDLADLVYTIIVNIMLVTIVIGALQRSITRGQAYTLTYILAIFSMFIVSIYRTNLEFVMGIFFGILFISIIYSLVVGTIIFVVLHKLFGFKFKSESY